MEYAECGFSWLNRTIFFLAIKAKKNRSIHNNAKRIEFNQEASDSIFYLPVRYCSLELQFSNENAKMFRLSKRTTTNY